MQQERQRQQQQQQQDSGGGGAAVQPATAGPASRSILDYFCPVAQQPGQHATVQQALPTPSSPVGEAGQAEAATSSGPAQGQQETATQASTPCSCCTEQQREAGGDCLSKVQLLLHRLLAGGVRSLCIQSPMGTGKTTLLKNLVTALDQMLGRPARILIFSYRQALSRDMLSNFAELGFDMYLDYKPGGRYFESGRQLWECDRVIDCAAGQRQDGAGAGA